MEYIQMKHGYPEKSKKRPKHGAFVSVKLHSKDLEFDEYRLEHKPSCQETFFVADYKDPRWEDRLIQKAWKLLL